MARANRCEFQGAIHLATLSGYAGGQVFYDPQIFKQFRDNPRGHAPSAEHFESLLWDTCEQYGARVHAYVLEPNTALVVIQTGGAPLSWIVHDLLARFSTYLVEQHRIPVEKKPFPQRYKAQIVQPGKLPYVVRYVQRREVSRHPRRRALNHPFSSHLIYCNRRPRPECFVVTTMQHALERLGYLGQAAYFEFMTRSDSPAIAHMLSRKVIGEGIFVESAGDWCRRPAKVPSPDEILLAVTANLLRMEPEVACSSTHRGALARALVAWYAMRTGAARIGTVGRWFGVTSSDLRYLIRRHRQKNPSYFSKSLSELFPSLSVRDDVTPLPRLRDMQRERSSRAGAHPVP